MKKAKQILIIMLVILGFILLSNAFVLVALKDVLSKHDIFEGHDTAEHARFEMPIERQKMVKNRQEASVPISP